MGMASARRAMLLIFLVCSALTTASNGLQRPADIGKPNYPPSSDDLHNDPQKMDPLFIPHGTYEVTHNDPYHPPDSEPHPSDSEYDRSRFRRDSNGDFTTMVDRMEKISRVVNGISIQQGIINGTIKPDALISEFLNLGSLTFSDIAAINVDEVTKVIEEMLQLSKKLTKDDGTAKIESRFLLYESLLKKTEGIGQTLTIPEFDQYLKAVQTLITANPDEVQLKRAVASLKSFSACIRSLDEKNKTDVDTSTDLSNFPTTFGYVKDMSSYKPLLANDLLRTIEFYGPVEKVNRAVSMFQADTGVSIYSPVDKKSTAAIKGNLETLISLSANTTSSLSVLKNLRRLFVTRHHIRGNRLLTQTPGYPNGISDFGLIFSDLKDSWIQDAVDGQSDALAKALDNLRDLKINLQTSDGSFHLNSAEETNLMTTNGEMIELSRFTGMFDDLAKSIENIKITGDSTKMQPDNMDEFQNLIRYIYLLSDHLRALEVVVDVSGKVAADEGGHIQKLLETIKDPTPETALSLLDKLRIDPEFKKIVELVRSAEKSIGLLVNTTGSGNDNIIEIAKAVDKSSDQMQPYLSGLGGFLTKMDALRNVTGVDQVGEAIRTVQHYRNHAFKSSGFKKTSETLDKAKTSLTKLQKSVADMKGDTTPESTALVDLRDLFKDSQNIGAATRVFRSMQMVKEKKLVVMNPAMEKLLQDQLKKVSQKQQNQLNQMLGLDKQLKNLITAIDKIETSVKPSTSTDLVSLWPIFSLAKGAKGIPMDFLEISETIEELSKDSNLKSHQQDLLKIKNELETLDSLGLDYSKHKTAIKDTEESLKQLDLFFASYEKKVSSVVVSVSVPPSAQNSIAGSATGINAETEKSDVQITVLYIVISVLVLLGVGVILGKLYCVRRKNEYFEIVIGDREYEIYLADIICRILYFIAHYRQENEKMSSSIGFKLYFLALFEHTCKSTIAYEQFDKVTKNQKSFIPSKEPLSKNERLQIRKNKKLFREDQYIQANLIKYRNNSKLALFQPPQQGNPENDEVPETVGTFYWAMKTCKANLVVCLAKIGLDCFQYFPVEVGKSLRFADKQLVVTCKSLVNKNEGKVQIRTLEVKFNGHSAFTVTHAYSDEWTNNFFPSDNLSPIVVILKRIEKEKKIVFMHCDSGLHRSGILAQVIMNKARLEPDDGCIDYGSSVNDVRKFCSGVIKNGDEFLQMAAITFKHIRASFQERSPNKKFSDITETHINIIEKCILDLSKNANIELDLQKLHEMINGKKDVAKGSEVVAKSKNEDENKEAKANPSKGQSKVSPSQIFGIKMNYDRPIADNELENELHAAWKLIEKLKKGNITKADKDIPDVSPLNKVNDHDDVEDEKKKKKTNEKDIKPTEEKENKTVEEKALITAEPEENVNKENVPAANPQKETKYNPFQVVEDPSSDWGEDDQPKKKAK